MQQEFRKIINWTPIEGRWDFSSEALKYLGPDNEDRIIDSAPTGILASGEWFNRGRIRTSINLTSQLGSGSILLGYGSRPRHWLAIGIGSPTDAYRLYEFKEGVGWRRLEGAGNFTNLRTRYGYSVEVNIDGQRVTFVVDGIRIFDYVLDAPPLRQQVGLVAWGQESIDFSPVEVASQALTAFVVMQFSDQFDELYDDVIKPTCAEFGIEAYRADNIYRPGVILQDIIQGLTESHLVIAEITPENPNVFYELGYSHALGKQTILLADRESTRLPFDLSGYRVIFYDNTIRGKSEVENHLKQHLQTILDA